MCIGFKWIINVSVYEMERADLLEWADTELTQKVNLAYEGQGDFCCGEWCRFCKAKAECRERAEVNMALARYDFQTPALLDDEEIADILGKVDALTAWAADVKEYALQQAISGKDWTGWKLVEGRSNRKYTNDAVVAAIVKDAGFDPYERKVLGIRKMKSVFARRIYHADRMHIYQQKDTARQELQAQTRKAMVECIARLSSGAVENPQLEQLTEELAERLLTVKGRKVYGYLPPRVKAIVDAIVEELAKDERVSAAYETWQTLYEQVCLDYDQRPRKRLPLSQQKEFRSVRNMVIQETLQWIAERQRYADARRTPSAQGEPTIKKDAAEAAPKAFEVAASFASAQPKSDRAASAAPEDSASADDAASKGTTPPAAEDAPAFSQWSDHPNQQKESAPAGADHHAHTVGEAVVRMLHHMSRIFEDNSKIDQIHRGLQIDRKRRQELQRKRLAMGHKPDDHEEQTFG